MTRKRCSDSTFEDWHTSSIRFRIGLVALIVGIIALLFLAGWVDHLLDEREFRGILWSSGGTDSVRGNHAASILLFSLTFTIMFAFILNPFRKGSFKEIKQDWKLFTGGFVVCMGFNVCGVIDLVQGFELLQQIS